MNCQEVRELSSDYLDERLAPSEVSLLENHLRTCSACYQQVDALRTTISLIGSLDEIKTSPDFVDQVQRKIERGKGIARFWALFFEPIKIKVPLEVTVLIIISIGTIYIYHRSPELSKEHRVQSPFEDLRVPQNKPEDKSPKGKTASEERDGTAEGLATVVKPDAQPTMPRSLEASGESGVRSLSENLKVAQDRAQHEALEQKAKKQESDQIAKAPPVSAAKPEGQPSVAGALEPLKEPHDEVIASTHEPQIPHGLTERAPAGAAKLQEPSAPKSAPSSREAHKEAAALTPSPQVLELVADDVGLYEKKVKSLLNEVKGKLLGEERASGSGLLLTVELPKSRQAEFLAALKEDVNTESKLSALTRGAAVGGVAGKAKEEFQQRDALTGSEKAPERKLAPTLRSSLRRDEPTVTLQLRILPKK